MTSVQTLDPTGYRKATMTLRNTPASRPSSAAATRPPASPS